MCVLVCFRTFSLVFYETCTSMNRIWYAERAVLMQLLSHILINHTQMYSITMLKIVNVILIEVIN